MHTTDFKQSVCNLMQLKYDCLLAGVLANAWHNQPKQLRAYLSHTSVRFMD